MSNLKANSTCVRLSFLSDGCIIKGHLHIPTKKNFPVVIGSHGLLATQNSPKQTSLAEACNNMGIGFLRFDHRGCGLSEGEEKDRFSFEVRCQDLLSAYNAITQIKDAEDAIALFGSSFGGAVACRVAAMIQPRALVTFAAPTNSRSILDTLEKHHLMVKQPKAFFQNVIFDIENHLSCLKNIMVIHGENDEIVPVSEAHKIYRIAANPKRMIVQKRGDHRMSNTLHQADFVRVASHWFFNGFERS